MVPGRQLDMFVFKSAVVVKNLTCVFGERMLR